MTTASAHTQSSPARRVMLFRVLAVALALLPFLLLEAGLRIVGVAVPVDATAAVAGFDPKLSLFERIGSEFQTRRSREQFFNPQTFVAEKPADGFRVFTFGGSTTYGHPYTWETAFGEWLRLELAAGNPGRSIETINCGGISYASYRIAPLVAEALTHKPDLIVIATGHNEFLEDRTYQSLKSRSAFTAWIQDRASKLRTVTLARRLLKPAPKPSPSGENPPEVNARLDDARTGYASYHRDDAWHAQVVAQFHDSLKLILTRCREARVPVMLVALGSNLRDCPPFKSEHRADLSAEDQLRWQAEFDRGTQFEAIDLEAAIEHYRAAEVIDPRHALGLYRLARCLDRTGQLDEALSYYRAAKEEDICPLRMIEEVRRAQFELAAAHGVPVIDAAEFIDNSSRDGIPGNDAYVDHVHPTIGGQQRIARVIAAGLSGRNALAPAPWNEPSRAQAYANHLSSLAPGYIGNGLRRVEWLDNWSRRQKLHQETLPVDARGHLHAGFRMLELGNAASAWKSLAEALRLEPRLGDDITAFAKRLATEGRATEARDLLATFLNQQLPDDVRKRAGSALDQLEPAPQP